jgi:lipoate-protein ligase A
MLQKALSPDLANRFKKATASVPSPVRNIRSFLNEQYGSAPKPSVFFATLTSRLLTHYGLKEVTLLKSEEISKIEELQRNKYTQREWDYRM